MKKIWTDAAWSEYVYWQSQDKKTLKKINSLIKAIERADGKPLGKGELLKGNFSGCASVRIDDKNRLVYRIRAIDEMKVLEIVQCGLHYKD